MITKHMLEDQQGKSIPGSIYVDIRVWESGMFENYKCIV